MFEQTTRLINRQLWSNKIAFWRTHGGWPLLFGSAMFALSGDAYWPMMATKQSFDGSGSPAFRWTLHLGESRCLASAHSKHL